MSNNKKLKQIKAAIDEYADGYANLEEFQGENNALIPKCDQKTGAIGEFYAMIFARHLYKDKGVTLEFGPPSQHGWDIKISKGNKTINTIQVKAVSGFSETSTISPIHPKWKELWLMRLDEQFYPIGLWVVKRNSLKGLDFPLSSKKMPKSGVKNSGSKIFENKVEHTKELLEVLSTTF